MRSILVACTFWIWRPVLVRWLQQTKSEYVISKGQYEALERSINWDNIWERV